jgi:hypothetical protein
MSTVESPDNRARKKWSFHARRTVKIPRDRSYFIGTVPAIIGARRMEGLG